MTDSLVEYMTSVLDIGYPQQYKTMTEDAFYGTDFELEQNQSKTDLKRVLADYNLDLVNLFEALAVRYAFFVIALISQVLLQMAHYSRCDEFIPLCEIHRTFYMSPVMHPGHPKSCCGFFFQEKPFFTYQGTCFTTKETVTEFYPASSASIRVWLYMNESASPEFSLLMRGSDAAERQGVVWTLSHEDHPMGVLEKDFNRVDSGKVAAVSITMSEARKIYTCIFLPCIRLIFFNLICELPIEIHQVT